MDRAHWRSASYAESSAGPVEGVGRQRMDTKVPVLDGCVYPAERDRPPWTSLHDSRSRAHTKRVDLQTGTLNALGCTLRLAPLVSSSYPASQRTRLRASTFPCHGWWPTEGNVCFLLALTLHPACPLLPPPSELSVGVPDPCGSWALNAAQRPSDPCSC